ncbi:hypothetical protein G7046_g5960 [Stylonectria norvegica]|nr:hypothetical protein G7046_g5960 [Stylonectria norvegica]
MSSTFLITCHCGNLQQSIKSRQGADEIELTICHCDVCRHSSGLLCTSYYPVREPGLLHKVQKRDSNDGFAKFTSYFCSTCGCHVFRFSRTAGWEVATGVMRGKQNGDEGRGPLAVYRKHRGVEDTGDGGIARWLTTIDGRPLELTTVYGQPLELEASPAPAADSKGDVILPARCDCGTVNFHITRPDERSSHPRSSFPDLMYPYSTTDESLIKNPSDVKWWLRDGSTRYLAGLCACRSCRLTSGFELQTWAFVPRSNIFFHSQRDGKEIIAPLDFETLPSGILRNYQSSPGVLREFCGGCGASVFWHNEARPDIIDVSVGLLRGAEGARAESWLEWWGDRVSFTEDAELDRWGEVAGRARSLVAGVEDGLSS